MADNGHNDPSRSRFEDDFSAALRRDIDRTGGPIGAGVRAELFGDVRRRRTSRAITATALSTVLVLGVGGIGWTVASNLGNRPGPQIAGPTTTGPPQGTDWSDGCSLTSDNFLDSPMYADGWTLDAFALAADGRPSAEFNGPDSLNQEIDSGMTLGSYNPNELKATIDQDSLRTVWLPAESEADRATLSGDAAWVTGTAGNRADPLTASAYQRWSVRGSGLDTAIACAGNRSGAADQSEDGNTASAAAPVPAGKEPGIYFVLGLIEVSTLTDKDDATTATVYSSNAVMVELGADGKVTTLASTLREGATQRNDSDDSMGTEATPSEGIVASDGRELSFDYRDSQLTEAVEVSAPDEFTTSEGPLADITLLGQTSKDGVWFANRPETADWRDLRFGTWSQADGFKPWTKTRDIAPSKETRFASSVAVAGDDPDRIVWIESEGFGTGVGGFWVFTADADTGQIGVLATPDDTASNTFETPTVTASDGRAYWSTSDGGEYVIESRAIDGSGDITIVARNATLPTAGRNSLYALQTGNGRGLNAVGVVELTDKGAQPFLTFPIDPGPLPGLQVSDQSVAVTVDSTLYVVPQGEDTVVWTLSLDDGAFPHLTSNGYLFWSVADDDDLYTIYGADTGSGSDRIMRANLCQRSCGPSNSLRKHALGGAWADNGGAVAWVTPADDAIQATGLILRWPLTTMINEVG